MSKNTVIKIAAALIFHLIVFGLAYHFAVSPIPVEECPPNVGVAQDGSCGIYEPDVRKALITTFFFATIPTVVVIDIYFTVLKRRRYKQLQATKNPISR